MQSVSGRNKCVCSSSHALCYRHVRSCEIHNSFASYDGTSFVLVVLAGLIVSEPKHWVTWSRRTGDKIESSILVFLLNKIIFNSFLLVVQIISNTFFWRKLKDFCLIKSVFDKKSGTYWGLMDNERNIFVLNLRCF